jgi:two-component system NtrC family sensor kinase
VIQDHNLQKKIFRPIKAKLLFAVLTISTVLTSFVIFFNFYIEYNSEIGTLRSRLQQINESSIPAINSAVWNVDKVYLTVLVDSIVKIRDIVSVKVSDPKNNIILERKNTDTDGTKSSDLLIYKYPLYHKHYNSSKVEHIGNVELVASTTQIKEQLYDRIVYFVIAQFIKTFLLSWIILLIFHHYINKNIEQIIQFSKSFDLNSMSNKNLVIKRKSITRDEFDILQDEINKMIEQINILNLEKESKISEQEKKIEMQQVNAINNSKLVALGEMAGGVAHEINNPLAIIHSHTQLMERMIEKNNFNKEQYLKSLKAISTTIDRIKNIVKGLRNISRDATTEKPDFVPLKPILLDVFSLCDERFKSHDITLIYDLKSPAFNIPLHCRQIQLSQVFLNLLNNSFDAIVDLEEKWIKIEAEVQNNRMIINMIDSGHGIAYDIQQKIFQPFFTTKEIGKGTGLGLSLVHRMITDHGGEIYYNQSYSHTCFTIELPIT